MKILAFSHTSQISFQPRENFEVTRACLRLISRKIVHGKHLSMCRHSPFLKHTNKRNTHTLNVHSTVGPPLFWIHSRSCSSQIWEGQTPAVIIPTVVSWQMINVPAEHLSLYTKPREGMRGDPWFESLTVPHIRHVWGLIGARIIIALFETQSTALV